MCYMLLVLKIYNVDIYKYMLLQIMHFTAYNTARLQAHFSKYMLPVHRPGRNICALIDAIPVPHSSGLSIVNGIMKHTRPVTLT